MRRTPQGRTKNRSRLPEVVGLVSEPDRDEVVEEAVEALDVAGRVGRKVSCPLDGPLERGIRATLAVNVPPARRFQDDERVRRWVLAR